MAYFLGKEMTGNMDDLFPDLGRNKGDCLQRCKEQLSLDPGFDYQGCINGCGGMRVQPGEATTGGEVTTPGTITGPVVDPNIVPDVVTPTEEPTSTDWIDNLVAGMFGKGFETVRGIGGRTRESVFDTLAREGLMGTGAARDVSQDIAWQTEQGISNLMRGVEQWKYQQEQESMNQMLQYLFSMMGSWR
ncbi:MAG: hypothetical protein KAW52_00250 [candidate division Zixibacteria bacterium]|nr:hypothetical protein [candidate division Zixibacteria bacterium]